MVETSYPLVDSDNMVLVLSVIAPELDRIDHRPQTLTQMYGTCH